MHKRLRLSARGFTRTMLLAVAALTLFASGAEAQQTVFDDALQNSFQNYSFGGGSDFASTAQAHSGTKSIAFTGNNFNAMSFARPGQAVDTAVHPTIHLWLHGGATGGQQLRIILQLNNVGVASQELDSYITGNAPAAGVWREVVVNVAAAPFNIASYDRIDLQSDIGGAQPTLYVDDLTLNPPSAAVAPVMTIDRDVTVASMTSDRFTWSDASANQRVAVLAHNDAAGPGGAYGGALREFRYKLPNGTTRTATVTTYGNGGYRGFGYVVSHASRSNCVADDSPLGGSFPGTWERIFEGRHHAIFRFRQNYPRNCSTGVAASRTLPIVIDWVFSTGRDNPLWAVTWHIDQSSPAAPAGTFWDDSRAPYGELNIDGSGFIDISGVAWGDRYKFFSTTAPVTLNSTWTWNTANSVPWVKLWIDGPLTGDVPPQADATMGVVQTQTMTQQDAGGGRETAVGTDESVFWNKTSAQGSAGPGYSMPDPNYWPYQANGFNLYGGSNANARLTWRTQYGFIGQTSYNPNDGVVGSAPGYPKKSYSTYVVLGTHTSAAVESQVTQVEVVQSLTLSASTGSVVTSGPAGIDRADTITYAPAGYNHVYGALAFNASSNHVTGNITVGSGTLKHPMLIVGNYTGAAPVVQLGGVTLTADADYFASLRAAASEVWITLNRDLTGPTNALDINAPPVGGVPAAPTSLVAAATTTTRVDLSWAAPAGVIPSYQIDRRSPGGAFAQVGTSPNATYSDLSAIAGTSYLYRVRAVNGSGPSANSTPDLATTIHFTDAALAGIQVKATHLAQLRSAVNAVRTLAALGAAPATDAATAGTTIKAVHVTELRTALDAARTSLGLPNSAYTDAGLAAGTLCKAVHFQELRDRTQ
jgi:hypothetical protein